MYISPWWKLNILSGLNWWKAKLMPKTDVYQYLGVPGSTYDCLHAVRLILTGGGYFNAVPDPSADTRRQLELLPTAVTIVTAFQEDKRNPALARHAFVFWDWITAITVVPSGFGSGYGGTGPSGFSDALLMIFAKDLPAYELLVGNALLERMDQNALVAKDIRLLEQKGRSRSLRFSDYVEGWYEDKYQAFQGQTEPRIPWEWMDPALIAKCEPLAVTNPKSALSEAFIVLKTRLVECYGVGPDLDGQALYSAVFGEKGILLGERPQKDKSILALRTLLEGLYGVFRNPYSHNDVEVTWEEAQTVLWTINFALKAIARLPADSKK